MCGIALGEEAGIIGVIVNADQKPIANAMVVATTPPADMRDVRDDTKRKLFRAVTGQDGSYRLGIPDAPKGTEVSLDVFARGYRSLAGTFRSGGDDVKVKVVPGADVAQNLVLERALYVSGVAVDETGKAIPNVEVHGRLMFDRGYGDISTTLTGKDGRFELFDFPLQPDPGRGESGHVSLEINTHRSGEILDVYKLSAKELSNLTVIMQKGRVISGTVVDADGKPVSKVFVWMSHKVEKKGKREKEEEEKGVTSDESGRFVLAGMPLENVDVTAHAMKLKQKIKKTFDLKEGDAENVELRLAPVKLKAEPRVVSVLGMKLADATEELQALYDMNDIGVFVLDPGNQAARLGFPELAEGNKFWLAGENRFRGVRGMITAILKAVDNQPPESKEFHCQVAYSHFAESLRGIKWSSNPPIKLTPEDVKELRATLESLSNEKK